MRSGITIAAVSFASFVLVACGGGGGRGGGDSARFDVAGTVVSVTENGTGTINVGAPAMDYSGPLGCRGRYFTAEYPDGVDLDFRYTGRDAYLVAGGALYHLLGGPSRSGGALHWHEDVDGTPIDVTVDCPAPPNALPPLSATAATNACALLSRRLAIQTLGRGVGRRQLLKMGPFDTTCIYQGAGLSSVSLALTDAAITESEPLWHDPTIGGLGVPAHAAPAPDGIVAVKGNTGLEVVVGLGGSQAADTAAEVRVTRRVLAQLAG